MVPDTYNAYKFSVIYTIACSMLLHTPMFGLDVWSALCLQSWRSLSESVRHAGINFLTHS